MGFFTAETEGAPRVAGRKARVNTVEQIRGTERGCANCALKANWAWLASPQMKLSGNTRDPEVLIIGDTPSAKNDRDGSMYAHNGSDAASVMLRKLIPGRELENVAFGSLVRCGTKQGQVARLPEYHACSIHLEEDLARFPNLRLIIGVGHGPLSYFFGGVPLNRVHGTLMLTNCGRDFWFYPVFSPDDVLETGEQKSPLLPVLRADIKKAFNLVSTLSPPVRFIPSATDVLLPETEQEASDILARMAEPRGVDIETNCLRPFTHGSRILTAACSDGNLTMAWSIDHPENPTKWGMDFLLQKVVQKPWIAHQAGFEYTWMSHAAQRAGHANYRLAQFDDSMAAARVFHARETILGLDLLSHIHLGVDFKEIVKVNRKNMIEEPLEKILPYNGLDAQACVLLFQKMYPHINRANYERFINTIQSNAEMELRGLDADLDENKSLQNEWEQIRADARRKAATLYEVKQYEAEKQTEFNLASNEHLGIALVEYGQLALPKTSKRSKTGVVSEGAIYSTDEQHLRTIGQDNPLAQCALTFREADKQLSTYVLPVARLCAENDDNRLHPGYTALFTATTRLSAESPNVQNFPARRHRELRRQIKPPPGHVLLSADYGQLEARVYGCITKDPELCRSIIAKEDIHSHWRDNVLDDYPDYIDRLAMKTNETEVSRILKGGRNIIKTDFVFATFFGSNAHSCAERTGIPLEVTMKLVKKFWARYSVAEKWVKGQRQLYTDTGSVFTMCGVERHGILPGNEVINTPVQGTAAHVVLEAQNALSALSLELDDPYLHPRINIHDDLTFILPDDTETIDAYMEVIAQELLKVRFPWQIVPWMVEFKIGTDWERFEAIGEVVGDYVR